MDLDSSRAELARRKEQNLCYSCGKSDHRAAGCPSRPLRLRTIEAIEELVAPPTLLDEDAFLASLGIADDNASTEDSQSAMTENYHYPPSETTINYPATEKSEN